MVSQDWRRRTQERDQVAANSPLLDLPIRQVMGDAHYLPQPALPEVPGRRGTGMAGRARGRAVAGRLLPRRVHAAGSDRRHRLAEQGRDLRSAVQGVVRDDAHDRRRPEASRRPHRHHCPCSTPGARRMTHHPHVHMIVPGGGISLDGAALGRLPARLLPARACAVALFRRLFMDEAAAAHRAGELQFFGTARRTRRLRKPFAAYLAPLRKIRTGSSTAKRPFAGPEAVLAYLSRYTHRVAISNRRLIAADETGVTFKCKDYRLEGPGRYKIMTLATHEFIRRFLIHVLPNGFHRIRHYGLLANGHRADSIARARELLNVPTPEPNRIKQPHRAPPSHRPCRILSLLRWPHAHHRDVRARRNPAQPPERANASDQDRHVMIVPAPPSPRIALLVSSLPFARTRFGSHKQHAHTPSHGSIFPDRSTQRPSHCTGRAHHIQQSTKAACRLPIRPARPRPKSP